MLDLKTKPPIEFPDDPLKWDGWSKYKSDNFYERLCLDPKAKPDDEEIQQHCAALLQWWQKKLRLKNQPSNPMAQLLGRGIDEASNYLVHARMELLDPERRLQIDEELAEHAEQEALAEFSKYVAVSIAGKVLTAEAEANLVEFGQHNGLTEEQTRACIDEELRRNKARRAKPVPPPQATPETEKDFERILRLSHLNLTEATYSVRKVLVVIAESLGLPLERGEKLLEDYLDREECVPTKSPAPSRDASGPPRSADPVPSGPVRITFPVPTKTPSPTPIVQAVPPKTAPSRFPPQFVNPAGSQMLLIPAGEFVMGSDAPDALPDEQPLSPMTLTEFYMSRHPVTNAQYEQFDPSHSQKRIRTAGDDHPVVYVTSIDAINFCQWLGQRDGKNYRLPTEAEWEYAARGTDGRKYPWGNHDRRGGSANFADASTTFAWRDAQINDGYPETSPVGAFPDGASFFGLADMAGNVWEWCLDFYHPLPGPLKRSPRGPATGSNRVYRGGSWKSCFTNLRATARSSNAANYSCNDVGFRVVCDCSPNDSV
jgi:formylglycine-generating enzyme required for sulfatase activity